MEVKFSDRALNEIEYWNKTGNKAIMQKISKLIDDIILNHYSGIGKPEPLKYDYLGYWSRRINREHRIVYQVIDNTLYIASLRFHYDN